MKFDSKIIINASAKDVFSYYKNVDKWSSWDPDVKASSVNGKFETGAIGKLKPTKGPEAKILFSSVVADKSFTVISKLPLCKMSFEHELLPNNLGTVEVIHRVSFSGFFAPVFARLIGSEIRKGLPHTLNGLKVAVESTS